MNKVKLGDVISVKHGWAFKGEFFSNSGNQIVLTPANFYEQGGFKTTPGKEKYYSSTYPAEYLLKKGNLVVAMTEQSEGLLGSAGFIPCDNVYLHNQRIGLITAKSHNIDLRLNKSKRPLLVQKLNILPQKNSTTSMSPFLHWNDRKRLQIYSI